VIASLASELDKAQSVKEECETGLVNFEKEVQSWKEEAREQKAEASRLNCHVRRFAEIIRVTEITW